MDYSHTLLALSMLAVVVGPLAYQVVRVAGYMLAALDGFVFIAIGGLVLFHIIPDSIALAGWPAVVGPLIGLTVPTLIEHRLRGLARQVHAIALLFGLTALALHGFTDGMALVPAVASGDTHREHMLPMAVLLHRLPVGLTVWFLLRPVYGMWPALGALSLIAATTAAGFGFGEGVSDVLQSQARGVFQAVVAGSLLHVVIHRSYPLASRAGAEDGHGAANAVHAGIGGAAGLGLLWLINSSHAPGPMIAEGVEVFATLAVQSAPALLLAYVAAGLVYAFLPQASVAWMGRGSSLSQSVRGMGFGLPLPICSCGVVPVYRSLVLQGVPASAGMAFLVATPELSLDAVLISLPLLGGEMTIARVLSAAAVALLIGWGLGHFVTTHPGAPETGGGGQTTARERLAKFSESFWEVVDSTSPWILAGLALASTIAPSQGSWVELLPGGFGQVELFALLGMPVYVCASGATPLVAVLIYQGISPGAALAFLLTGPATNVTTFGILSRLHGRWVALAFGGGIAVLAVLAGHAVNALLPAVATNPLEHAHAAEFGVGEISLVLLGAVVAYSFVRRGPRDFMGELFETGGDDDAHDGHCHDETDCQDTCAHEPAAVQTSSCSHCE